MHKLKHDDMVASWLDAAEPGRRRASGTARLTGWLRRALGRDCGGGLWTLSLDGKLNCEPLGCARERPD